MKTFPRINIRRAKRVLALLAVLVLTLALVWVHRRNLPYSFDDSYIHFRIARNFVETGRPYYNLNEPVMASTSSAWTIILAVLFFLFGPALVPVAILNAIFTMLGAVLFYWIFREIQPEASASPFALLVPAAYIAVMFPASLGLMETSVSMAVFGLALLLFLRKKLISFILLGSLPFFRPEFILITGLMTVYALLRKAFPFRRILVNLFLGALPFLVYGFTFFRTIIPNSIIAKSHGYQVDSWSSFQNFLLYTFPMINLPAISWDKSVFVLSLACVSIILVMLAILAWVRKTEFHDFHKILLADAFLVIAFYVAGRSKVFPWYHPLFLVPFYLGILFTFSKGNRFYKLAAALLVLPVILNMTLSVYGVLANQSAYVLNFDQNARVAKYISIGKSLYKRYPQAVLAAPEIGGLGWGFEGYIADGFGLASPQAIQYQNGEKNKGNGVIPVNFILALKPGIIVSMDGFDQSFRKNPFSANYIHYTEHIYLTEDEKKLNSDSLWKSKYIDVFIRKDIALGNKR